MVEKYSMLLFSSQAMSLLAAGLRSLLVAAAVTPQAEQVSWEEVSVLRAQPMQGELQLVLQFHSIERDWEPYCTPFSERTHLAVRAWSDSQLPWVRSEYEAPRARYFVKRGSAAERLLLSAAPHDRVAVVGRIRAQCFIYGIYRSRGWGITLLTSPRRYISATLPPMRIFLFSSIIFRIRSRPSFVMAFQSIKSSQVIFLVGIFI